MDKIVNVFFSQPMHGLTDEEIAVERTYMISEFRDFLIDELGFNDDVVICDVNGGYVKPGPEDAGRLWYLGRSIQNMDKADYIVFHKNWTTANGCCAEHNIAINYFNCFHLHKVSSHVKEVHFGRNK